MYLLYDLFDIGPAILVPVGIIVLIAMTYILLGYYTNKYNINSSNSQKA
jgi:hypothetical protein